MSSQRSDSLYHNRFSILLAILAFGFTVIYMLPVETEANTVNILGIRFELAFTSFIPFLLAVLAALGAVWVFLTHPIWQQQKPSLLRMLPHLMLPFIATMILAVVLRQSARSLVWWVVCLIGYIIVALLLRAEYVLIEDKGIGNAGYSVMVISFSFGLFLLLTIALKNSDIRMIAQFFMLLLSGLFVSLRLLSLREGVEDKLLFALLASLLVTELAVGLHYVFIRPIQYGLLLTGLLYSLVTWLNQYKPGKKLRQYPESIAMAVVTLLLVVVSSFG